MASPKRSDENTQISISLEKALLEQIDIRAKSLGFTRSQYLIRLAENDIAEGGEFRIKPKSEMTKVLYDLNKQTGASGFAEESKTQYGKPLKPKRKAG